MPESTDNYRKAVADRLREEANAPLGLPTLFKCLHPDEDLPTTQDGYSLASELADLIDPAAQQSGLPKDKNGDPIAAGSYVMIEEHFTAFVYEVVAVDNSGVFYRMRTENCSDWEENWTSPDGYSLVYKCGKCVELLHDSWKKLRDDLDECVSKGGSRGIGKEAAAKFADRAAKLAEVE